MSVLRKLVVFGVFSSFYRDLVKITRVLSMLFARSGHFSLLIDLSSGITISALSKMRTNLSALSEGKIVVLHVFPQNTFKCHRNKKTS
jgi:hypothetical protein